MESGPVDNGGEGTLDRSVAVCGEGRGFAGTQEWGEIESRDLCRLTTGTEEGRSETPRVDRRGTWVMVGEEY